MCTTTIRLFGSGIPTNVFSNAKFPGGRTRHTATHPLSHPPGRGRKRLCGSILLYYYTYTLLQRTYFGETRITLRKLTARRLRLDAAETSEPRAERVSLYLTPQSTHHIATTHPTSAPFSRPIFLRSCNNPWHFPPGPVMCICVCAGCCCCPPPISF